MEKEMIEIIDTEGLKSEVELVTFLNSDNNDRQYIVYTKGETQGLEKDQVIYISRVINEEGILKLVEIEDDAEWNEVQRLLRKIANKVD
ncbi:MAG: DUF1292 domain-containing protein [Firmicutes bacterium]|nr:DUF1292 domain-containing protein [Bacillota bacterium]